MNLLHFILASVAVLATAAIGTAHGDNRRITILPKHCDRNWGDHLDGKPENNQWFVWNYFGTTGDDHFDPNIAFREYSELCPPPILPERLAFVFSGQTLSEDDEVVGLHCTYTNKASEIWLVEPGLVKASQFRGVANVKVLVVESQQGAKVNWPAGTDSDGCSRDTASKSVISRGGGNNTVVLEGYSRQYYSMGGGEGSETFIASAGNDYLDGAGGNDSLHGQDGDDTLLGGEGDDSLNGGAGMDTIEAGRGDDQLHGEEGDDTMTAGDGDDVAYGGDGHDTIEGGEGDDRLYGQSGNDVIDGGNGNDYLSGWDGADRLNGGWGGDTIRGESGRDTLIGDSGFDELYGGDGPDRLEGGEGHDKLFGDSGIDELLGGEGDDDLEGGSGPDKLRGGAGEDRLDGGDHDDRLFGDADNDELDGGAGTDVVHGGGGNDVIFADAGGDTLLGETGNDRYIVADPKARIIEIDNQGTDQVITTLARFRLPQAVESLSYDGSDAFEGTGNGLDNVITGGDSNDTLVGRTGNDWLMGGDGEDRLDGGPGDDTLNGGDDNDVFVVQPGCGHDNIYDWNIGDRIDATAFGLSWPDVVDRVEIELLGDTPDFVVPTAVEIRFEGGVTVTLHAPEDPWGVSHLDLIL